MNSEIVENNRKTKYPKMMRKKQNDMIVLFHKPSHGTVLYASSSLRFIGQYETNWSDMSNPEDWETFYGTLQISG